MPLHRALPVTFCLLAMPLAADDLLVLPSGLEVTLQEVLWEDEAETGRFRFIVPTIAAPGGADGVMLDDMLLLCRDFALPVQRALRPGWAELVISFASEPSEFGVMNAEIVQFFEGFGIDGDDCIWSEF